jgi:hydroxymethylpyrimidine kinase/phosphomethylpyrimidine kinase/thiamine-phosphate diphosphorylase
MTTLKSSSHIKSKPIVWSIAASDSGGGAGIQADIKTLHGLGVHACTLITAITAQNTISVNALFPLDREQINAQLNTLDSDLRPCAVKIGVLPTPDALIDIIKWLELFEGFSVWDPVIKASTGASLSSFKTNDQLPNYTALLKVVTLITPNCLEATQLTGIAINNNTDMIKAAKVLLDMGAKSVLIKGGHSSNQQHSQDLYMSHDHAFWMSSRRQTNIYSHGTGCTLSSAIAAFMAQNLSIQDSLVMAHAFVQQGLRTSSPLGRGEGPVNQGSWPTQFCDYPSVFEQSLEQPLEQPLEQQSEFPTSQTLGIYAITDNIKHLTLLLNAGVKTLQLRIKSVDQDALENVIIEAVKLGEQYKARIYINDHWQLAINAKAYGIHLGQEDLCKVDLNAIKHAGLQLGISTHNIYEICLAHHIKPSYIAIGPIFHTNTKQVKADKVGITQLQQWTDLLKTHYSLTCIGGINMDNSLDIRATGIPSIALVSLIDSDKKIEERLPALLNQFPY